MSLFLVTFFVCPSPDANKFPRYKFDVKLRFITEELGFESDSETVHFILEHAPEELLQQQEDGVKLLTGKAGLVFEQAKAAAHRVIDIKGQI